MGDEKLETDWRELLRQAKEKDLLEKQFGRAAMEILNAEIKRRQLGVDDGREPLPAEC